MSYRKTLSSPLFSCDLSFGLHIRWYRCIVKKLSDKRLVSFFVETAPQRRHLKWHNVLEQQLRPNFINLVGLPIFAILSFLFS